MTARRALLRAGPTVVLPLAVYALLRPRLASEVVALSIAAVVPALWMSAVAIRRRRLDPVGLVALAAIGAALAVSALSGSSLPVKLEGALVSGPLGLACLLSVALRRPLHQPALRLALRRDPARLEAIRRAPHAHRRSMVITAIAGATLTVHALVRLVLAVELPTAAFLAASRPVGWAIGGAGVLALFTYLRRARMADSPRPAGARE